jgi:hypothetical protein
VRHILQRLMRESAGADPALASEQQAAEAR